MPNERVVRSNAILIRFMRFLSVPHSVNAFLVVWFPVYLVTVFEPRREKTGLRDFRPGPTQTGLYKLRSRLEALNFGFKKKRNCTIRVAKTKALISFAVTAKLICAFVFA